MMKKEFQKRFLSSLILIPLCFFFIIKGSFLFNFFLIIFFFVTSYEWFKMSKKKLYHLPGYLFLFFAFSSAYILRNNFGQESLIYFLMVIIICISTDIGGYIFGKIFKGPKITKISPKKTFSGMIGGYLMSITLIYFFYYYSYLIFDVFEDFNNKTLLFVFLVSSISQIGDIIISFFKRLSKVKDTGKIIPGHGGVLDRIDGMIFALPFSYIILSLDFLK